MVFLVPHAEVLTQPIGAARTHSPPFPPDPLLFEAEGGLSSMPSSETLDPGSRTLACFLDYAFGKKSMKKNASIDRSEAA